MGKTIKFNPSIPQRKENIYMEQFFSGADCNVYIDGVLCENVAGISFQLQEQLKPIYGYASRAYDDVAIGNRIVTGVLQLPLVSTEEAVTNICDAMNQLPSDVSISSLPEATVPYSNTVFEVNAVPEWVRAWMTEYGYNSEKSVSSSIPADINDVFTKAEYEAQVKLKSAGYDVNPTGIMDADTQKAIIGYQAANGLHLSGKMDKETMKALYSETDSYEAVRFKESCEVRTGPGTTFPVFYNGVTQESATLIKEGETYSKIRLFDGRLGYVLNNKFSIVQNGGV